MNEKPNRLINEKSPYLLQHAYNPVDWFPWGDEAFEKAVNENKLILLSIGYSTCHWCHQMAHDAFSDEETAKFLSDNYVSIKVDREERPDIDEVYMIACQLLASNCGWPLNIIMTPDKKPIFSATYLPAKPILGNPAFLSVLEEINTKWQSDQSKLIQIGDQVLSLINEMQTKKIIEEIDKYTLEKAFGMFSGNFDPEYGGFGPAPKFPSAHNLVFLLNWYKKSNDKSALEMVEKTLHSMYFGGIFDHIGGGFHRYSIDQMWLIPHFEKTLYDQALIVNAYLEAYQVTNNEFYAYVIKKTLDFVLKELTDKEGGFYSGFDADTEGEEGKFYAWSIGEINKVLESDAKLFCEFYGVTEAGNFSTGKNILFISESITNLSTKYNLSPDEIKQKIDICAKKLYEARSQRAYPHIDDKIITAWNGLMIKPLALAGKVFNDERYTLAAVKATNFIFQNLITADGNIARSYREGQSNVLGFLEDYAFLIYGLLELHQSSGEDSFLVAAKELADKMISDFYDEANGGFFLTSIGAETPLVRIKDTLDHALPSGNSIAAFVLLMLANITKNSEYANFANSTFNSLGHTVNQYPMNYSQLLTALMYSLE